MPDHSLRRTLVRRLLSLLVLVGCLAVLATYLLANRYITLAYDQSLFDNAANIAEQVREQEGRIVIDLPPQARKMLLADQNDVIIYRVVALGSGQVIEASAPFKRLPAAAALRDRPTYREARVGDRVFRIVSVARTLPKGDRVLVEVGETLVKRTAILHEIVGAVALAVLLLVMATVGLAWQGVRQALAPLDRLAEEAARRGADNLAPLDTGLAPCEARGLIDAINRMMSRLSDSLDAQRRFTANAAHQLKTPLAGLRLQASLALKERDPDEQRAFLQDIEQSAARTAHIVEQLLLLARAEHATTVMQTTIDLAACARSAVARMLNAALDRGVDLGYDGPGQTTPIPGNPVLVEEMIANLIDNALRYAAATEITVQIERNPAGFLLSVNDNGRGIPKADRARLLERFNRGDTASAGGAGLGLAIVQEIAERHGARVSIAEPTGGRGCRIEIGFSASGDAVTA